MAMNVKIALRESSTRIRELKNAKIAKLEKQAQKAALTAASAQVEDI
jgi:hypothetical protein